MLGNIDIVLQYDNICNGSVSEKVEIANKEENFKRKEKNEKKHFYRRFIPIVLGPGDVNIIMSDVLSVQS